MTPTLRSARAGNVLTTFVLIVGVLVVAVMGWLVGRSQTAAGGEAAARSGGWSVAEIQRTEERLDALEESVRALSSEAVRSSSRPESTPLSARLNAAESGPDLSGKPGLAARGSPGEEETWSERVQRALDRADALPVARDANPIEAVPTDTGDGVAQAGGSDDESATDDSTPPPDAEVLDGYLTALNQLLADSGLRQFKVMELTDVGERTLRGVSMVETSDEGVHLGTLHCEDLALTYRDRDSADLVLEGAYALRNGLQVEYPERRHVISIPGVLPRELMPESLLTLFVLNGESVTRESLETDAVLARYNQVLSGVESAAIRVRSLGQVIDGRLRDVVIDVQFDDRGRAVRSVHADVAWWELQAEAAYVELKCEGGALEVGGKTRPLFRDKYVHPLRNVHPDAWRTLPGVVVIAAEAITADG